MLAAVWDLCGITFPWIARVELVEVKCQRLNLGLRDVCILGRRHHSRGHLSTCDQITKTQQATGPWLYAVEINKGFPCPAAPTGPCLILILIPWTHFPSSQPVIVLGSGLQKMLRQCLMSEGQSYAILTHKRACGPCPTSPQVNSRAQPLS